MEGVLTVTGTSDLQGEKKEFSVCSGQRQAGQNPVSLALTKKSRTMVSKDITMCST